MCEDKTVLRQSGSRHYRDAVRAAVCKVTGLLAFAARDVGKSFPICPRDHGTDLSESDPVYLSGAVDVAELEVDAWFPLLAPCCCCPLLACCWFLGATGGR